MTKLCSHLVHWGFGTNGDSDLVQCYLGTESCSALNVSALSHCSNAKGIPDGRNTVSFVALLSTVKSVL